MLRLDKEKFFAQRQLQGKSFYYIHKGQSYEISLDYVISSIGSSEEKCLFLLNELNATDDFLINVYLEDLADECIQQYLRSNLIDEIYNIELDNSESYKFTINTIEYIVYRDDNGRYYYDHADKVEVGDSGLWLRESTLKQYLSGFINLQIFDCEKQEV